MPHRNVEPVRPEDLDEGDPLGLPDVQQGATHALRLSHMERVNLQGPKTRQANRNTIRTGSADGRR